MLLFADLFAPMPRRKLADMALWEQRISQVAAKWQGWSITKDQRGRAMVVRRERGSAQQKVMLPFQWTEDAEDDIQSFAKRLWKEIQNQPDLTLKGAFEAIAPKSDKHGTDYTVTWAAIEKSFKRELMEEGNQIAEKTYESSYLKFVKEAMEKLATGRYSNGRDLVRACKQKWEDKPASRGYCVDAIRKFLEHAVTEHNAPGAWLLSDKDAQKLKGKPAKKKAKATLTDQQVLDVVAAVEAHEPEWANVVRLIAATGIRAVECQYIVVRTNPATGKKQLFSTYEKAGGKNPSAPRFLFPLPIKGDDGIVHLWDYTETFHTMTWPMDRTGKIRQKIDGRNLGGTLRDDIPLWNEMRKHFQETSGEVLKPYVFRDTWNVRADRLGIPNGVKCRAFGNTPETNSRAYRTSDDAAAAMAFDAIYSGK